MNFVFFILFSLSVFLVGLLGYKKFRSTTLYALAIGGVVNANFFHAGAYPINCFGLPFGIDSVIYTLFIFCVVVMFIKEGKKSAYLLAFSSIIAIIFSAVIQLFADVLSKGSSLAVWHTFFTFLVSSFASVIAVIVMIEILSKIKAKNSYFILLIGVLVATIVNTLIYYPVATLINGVPENITNLLITSFIGKAIAIICGIFTLWIFNKIDNKNNQE